MNIFVGIVVTLSLHNLIGNCYQMDIDIPVFMQRWILPITKFINPDLASPQEFGTTQTQGGFNDNMDFHRNITFNADQYNYTIFGNDNLYNGDVRFSGNINVVGDQPYGSIFGKNSSYNGNVYINGNIIINGAYRNSSIFGSRNVFNGDVVVNGSISANDVESSSAVFGDTNLFNGNLRIAKSVTLKGRNLSNTLGDGNKFNGDVIVEGQFLKNGVPVSLEGLLENTGELSGNVLIDGEILKERDANETMKLINSALSSVSFPVILLNH